MTYTPTEPYIFKSGKHSKKSLEQIFFTDPKQIQNYLFYMQKGPPEKWNKMQRHLNWIREKAKNKKAVAICRFCGENTVTRFSVRSSSGYGHNVAFGLSFALCEKTSCQEKAVGEAAGGAVQFYDFNLLRISYLIEALRDKKAVIRMFRDVFGLPDRLTKEAAFDFFSK